MESRRPPSKLLTRREAAAYLGLKPQTLAAWAVTGRYSLPMIRVGRRVRNCLADLERWLAARTVGAVDGQREGGAR